jgi:hypothetical protein
MSWPAMSHQQELQQQANTAKHHQPKAAAAVANKVTTSAEGVLSLLHQQ